MSTSIYPYEICSYLNKNATVKYNTLPNGMKVITIDNVLKILMNLLT